MIITDKWVKPRVRGTNQLSSIWNLKPIIFERKLVFWVECTKTKNLNYIAVAHVTTTDQ